MSSASQKIAVLTGDLVNSSALATAQITHAFNVLSTCARIQEDWMGGPLHFTRHRGDGWQVALVRPEMALRSALMFRAALRAEGDEYDSYVGIAEGQADGAIGPDLNDETGKVFARSGQALERLRKSELPLRMVHDSLGAMDAAVILADQIFQQWTQAQAKAMSLALGPDEPISFTKIAAQLGKSRQAATKSIRAAGFDHIELALASLDRKPRA